MLAASRRRGGGTLSTRTWKPPAPAALSSRMRLIF